MSNIEVIVQKLEELQKSVDASKQRFDALEKENIKLREEIALLTNIIRDTAINPPRHTMPYQPYQPGFVPIPTDIAPLPTTFSSCPKCGLKLDSVMGYVCSQPQCPTGLGGAWCSS